MIIDGKEPDVAKAPELKDFVCLYEVALGMAELDALAKDGEKWPVLKERLEVLDGITARERHAPPSPHTNPPTHTW